MNQTEPSILIKWHNFVLYTTELEFTTRLCVNKIHEKYTDYDTML